MILMILSYCPLFIIYQKFHFLNHLTHQKVKKINNILKTIQYIIVSNFDHSKINFYIIKKIEIRIMNL